MSCVALVKYEYRCSRCFQVLYAEVEEAGSHKPCRYCDTDLVLPEATPDRIARAQRVADEVLTAAPVPLLFSEPSASDADLQREVRSQLSMGYGACDLPSSRIKRFFGAVIDSLLLGVMVLAGVVLLGTLMSSGFIEQSALKHAEITLDKMNAWGALYFPAIALTLIQWNLIATRGQSIGKLLLGMRIVNEGGQCPGFVQGVVLRNWLRAALSFIPLFSLIDALAIFGESRRCVHDFIAGTRVVDA